MPVVDTSILVPRFLKNHRQHTAASTALQGHERILVPTVVLAETSTILRRIINDHGKDGAGAARQAIQHLLSLPGVHETQTHPATLTHALWHYSPRLSYADAVTVATAIDQRRPLLTLDADQRKAWRKKMKRP